MQSQEQRICIPCINPEITQVPKISEVSSSVILSLQYMKRALNDWSVAHVTNCQFSSKRTCTFQVQFDAHFVQQRQYG